MLTGAESGKRGYFLTYMIAYLRDFGYDFWVMAESFETSVAWKQVRFVLFFTLILKVTSITIVAR